MLRGSKREDEHALVALSSEVIDGRFASTARTVLVLLDQWIEHLEAMGRAGTKKISRQGLARAGVLREHTTRWL